MKKFKRNTLVKKTGIVTEELNFFHVEGNDNIDITHFVSGKCIGNTTQVREFARMLWIEAIEAGFVREKKA